MTELPGGSSQPSDGLPEDLVPDAARAALARARLGAQAAAQADPRSPRSPSATTRRRGAAAYSGPGPDERDPQTLASSYERTLGEAGWTTAARAARLHELWPMIVGPANAEHAAVESFDPTTGILSVRATSTTWAESLRLMVPMLAERIDAQLGPGVVTAIRIGGPVAPSWVHGRRRVRGRGPRDTYG